MKTKHFRSVLDWETIDVRSVGFKVTKCWSVVFSAIRVHVTVFQVFNAVVLLESGEETTSVVIVCYSTSVVDMTRNEDKSIPWNIFLVFEEKFEHGQRCIEI